MPQRSQNPLSKSPSPYYLCQWEDLPEFHKMDDTTGVMEAFLASKVFFEGGASSWAGGMPSCASVLAQWHKAFLGATSFDLTCPDQLRSYLKTFFTPYRLKSIDSQEKGLFTGYYHPVLKGSRVKTATHHIPLYARPHDLIMVEDLGIFQERLRGIRIAGTLEAGNLIPYPSRRDIRQGALEGRGLELAWLACPVEAFFMMVQGSGTIEYGDGCVQTFHYAATNGHPYTSIGRELIRRNILPEQGLTADVLWKWLKKYPEQAQDIMDVNASYVFFQHSHGTCAPQGAIDQPLTSLRSLAVDPAFVPLGAPLWLNLDSSWGETYHHFIFAQDVGGAIKGQIRGDLYCGHGPEAFSKAGSLHHAGELFVLLPKGLAPPL